jgi:hypothetical protein
VPGSNLGIYHGSAALWRTRRIRRRLRPPLVWLRHRHLTGFDVALVSYPRSGSTWFGSMLAELLLGRDADFRDAHEVIPPVARGEGDTPRLLPGRGRLVRSHEPRRAEYSKAIYVVRDPRDVAVSYYHYRQWLKEYHGSLRDFVQMFLAGDVDSYGRWDDHVWSWIRDGGSDVFVLQFESLLADTAGCLAQAAAFLGLDVTADDVQTAIDHNSVDRMRAKGVAAHASFADRIDPQQGFVRGARAGTWILELSELDVAAIDLSFGELMSKLGYRSLFGILQDSSVGRPTSVDWAVRAEGSRHLDPGFGPV